MATLLKPLPQGKITREEVNRLLESGYFDGQRFELIDGELINKMGQGPNHAWALRRLNRLLLKFFGTDRVECQMPIEAGPRDQKWSQPEPDVIVLAPDVQFEGPHPAGRELTLAVEIADSSLRLDSILDIDGRQLLVFRDLQNDAYCEALTLSETDTLPHIGKPVAELL